MQPHRWSYSAYVLLSALVFCIVSPQLVRAQQSYYQTNLVSNGYVPANSVDPNLVNPWGLVQTATSPFWVSDQVTNLATVYSGSGAVESLVVTIPTASTPPNGPTGIVANTGTGFIPTGSTTASHFIFDDLNGNIYGWNSGATAVVGATVSGAHFTGLAINSSGTDIFATNFSPAGGILEFSNTWAPVSTTFNDPSLPSGYEPYNVVDMNGTLFVAYEPMNTSGPFVGQPLQGLGNGVIAEFNQNGTLLTNLITGGSLDDPWGMALAPSDFGEFSNDLLIGNFGNGEINAFNPTTGAFLGTLDNSSGDPISEGLGLWALMFGTGGSGSSASTLYITAGINNQADGLLAEIDPTPEPETLVLFGIGMFGVLWLVHRKRAVAQRAQAVPRTGN
jgi:uncharacterized protein (TIGR03118 family)